MSRSTIRRGDITLAFEENGTGAPVIFQHGLGADATQVAEIFPATPPRRLITLECRGHGQSEAGPTRDLSIATFADDLIFTAGRLGVRRAVFGGISMGAAIALRIAVLRPDLIAGLVLARPAWLFAAAPENMRGFALVGQCLAGTTPAAGRALFEETALARELAQAAPDNLASLRGFFERSSPEATAALLAAIARDGPDVTEAAARRITVPTLVIGTRDDLIHPLAYAARLAATIPRARLAEITSKVASRDGYVADFRAALAGFLKEIGPTP